MQRKSVIKGSNMKLVFQRKFQKKTRLCTAKKYTKYIFDEIYCRLEPLNSMMMMMFFFDIIVDTAIAAAIAYVI